MYYKCYKANFKRGASYIDLLDWIKNKKETINQKNEDDRCFQYSIIVALHHKEIKNHPERISPIHHDISLDYNWEDTDFPAGIKDWNRFEKNNETVALNILQVPQDEITITHAFK